MTIEGQVRAAATVQNRTAAKQENGDSVMAVLVLYAD